MWLTKMLTAVLAVCSLTAVHGQNACLAGDTCDAGKDVFGFFNCGLTNDDVGDLDSCFTAAGRSGIRILQFTQNQLTTLNADLFTGMTALEELTLSDNLFSVIPSTMLNNVGASLTSLAIRGNPLTTVGSGAFSTLTGLTEVAIEESTASLTTLPENLFSNSPLLEELDLAFNQFTTLPDGLFNGLSAVTTLGLSENCLTSIAATLLQPLTSVQRLFLDNNKISTIEAGAFNNLAKVQYVQVYNNLLKTLPSNLFADVASANIVSFANNMLEALPVDVFLGLETVRLLHLEDNMLTTLPSGIFEDIGSDDVVLRSLHLDGNPGLQCVPDVTQSGEWYRTSDASQFIEPLPVTADMCECTPVEAVMCDGSSTCAPGASGYTCEACTSDDDCDTDAAEVCCLSKSICEVGVDPGACGDPHMTGFRGQKFDFVGEDRAWYSLVSDLPYMHLNMRITSPVPSVPEITYITGISIITRDANGQDHTIVVTVNDPHNLESSCPVGMSSCLADGALHVVVNGEEVLLAPGELTLGPDIAISAVNLPGACRSFGFEEYWERKKLELLAQSGRRLRLVNTMQDMPDWVLSDPTATNIVECAEYVDRATAVGGPGLFAHQSEHASFQIMTPAGTVRLSHGRLHQLPMRDPTDQFDLPDHLTWQMNMAIDHNQVSLDATGILGETLVPTLTDNGVPIMQGMDAIRGAQEDYRVKGPLDVVFSQGQRRV